MNNTITTNPREDLEALKDEQINEVTRLLQDKEFAKEMAAWQDGAYYRGQGQTPPEFNAEPVQKEVHENIAMNLAGFYAVECGVGALLDMPKYKDILPVEILEKIVAKELPEEDMLLIARFANATWKAGQPFRTLDRITRPNFIPAGKLTHDELKKDFDQIYAAAEKMLEKIEVGEIKIIPGLLDDTKDKVKNLIK